MARTPIPLMTILVDTREQTPFQFAPQGSKVVWTTKSVGLATGDYQLEYPANTPEADRIVIERKSLADLLGSVTRGRDRLRNEFGRMRGYGYAVLIVEGGLETIQQARALRSFSKVHPRSVYGTLFAWSQRYGVHIWACPGREFAAAACFRMLERWWVDQHERMGQ